MGRTAHGIAPSPSIYRHKRRWLASAAKVSLWVMVEVTGEWEVLFVYLTPE